MCRLYTLAKCNFCNWGHIATENPSITREHVFKVNSELKYYIAIIPIITFTVLCKENAQIRACIWHTNEGLALKSSTFESLYSGQFTLSTQLIRPKFNASLLHRRITTYSSETINARNVSFSCSSRSANLHYRSVDKTDHLRAYINVHDLLDVGLTLMECVLTFGQPWQVCRFCSL